MKPHTPTHPFSLGQAHGRIPGHPFSPDPEWTVYQRSLYGQGFDLGVDTLIDQGHRLLSAA